MSGRMRVLDEPTAIVSVVDETTKLVTLPGVAAPPAAGSARDGGSPIDSAEFMWSDTSTPPPSTGQARSDTLDPTQSTKLWLHNVTATGLDVSRVVLSVYAGITIDVQDKDDASRYQSFTVTGDPVSMGTYVEIPIEWDDGGAPLPAQRVLVTIVWRRVHMTPFG